MPIWTPHWTVQRPGEPDETFDGNTLVYAGASAAWELLLGRTAVNSFGAAHGHIAVGSGSAALSLRDLDLAGPLKARQPLMPGYPRHDRSNREAAARIVFKASFPDGVAEFAWNEVGLANGPSGGRLFNRQIKALGTKPPGTPGLGWVVVLTFEITPEAAASP
ncbi:MAG TPA: hypothetical protein VII06_09600 [Chloroflexota bacterium]|jgi:hypothetical protein